MATSPGLATRTARDFQALLPQSIAGRTALSALAHGLALLLMANWWWLTAHRMRPAGLAAGTRTVVLYKPGKPGDPLQEDRPVVRKPHAGPRRNRPGPIAAPMQALPATAAIPAPDAQHETGDDARGDGSASLRYVQAFPDQRPDFSGLGATGDVVVDIQIDDTGHVQRAFARKGMGSAIDAMVIATVQRWMFDPARKDGRPVASVQELHFHYDRSWSKGNCGWDCIGLMSQ